MKTIFRYPIVAMITLALGLAACGDDPAGLEEEHTEPEGVGLVVGGVTVASFDGESWTGELELDAGEESAHIEVRFLDHDGEPITLDADYYLDVEVGEESVATFEQDAEAGFGGHVQGTSAGETEIVFRLMHGSLGAGHAEFFTTGLHVHVS